MLSLRGRGQSALVGDSAAASATTAPKLCHPVAAHLRRKEVILCVCCAKDRECLGCHVEYVQLMSERQVLCRAPGNRARRMRLKICCIKLSLAARLIAMVGLIASVLVLTQLSTELAEPDENGGTVSILLGLDVDDFWQSSSSNGTLGDGSKDMQGLEVLITFLIFSFIYATASAILIWGSIVEVSCYAYPWLVCEAVSFVTQIVTIYLHSQKTKRTDRWIVLLSAFNLVISVYFWVVVFCAARSWTKLNQEERENASTSTLSSGNETINGETYSTQQPQKPVQV